MNDELRDLLLAKARKAISDDDAAHDFLHHLRVLRQAERIAEAEGADLDTVTAAALLHDAVNYQKNDPRAKFAAEESAELAGRLLAETEGFPSEKIPAVQDAIRCHSFSHGDDPSTLEAKVVHDADKLEATGAVSIMRTFASTGIMKRAFYHPDDPFALSGREIDPLSYALDLFPARLMKVDDILFTESAKKISRKRTEFLRSFLAQLDEELRGSDLFAGFSSIQPHAGRCRCDFAREKKPPKTGAFRFQRTVQAKFAASGELPVTSAFSISSPLPLTW